MEKIGKKIIIKGEMLHHVGFRPYLLLKALKLRVKNFEAENIDDDGKRVDVLLIGDANQISDFADLIKAKKLPLPDTTKVIDVLEEEIDITKALDIADINEYRKWLGVEQNNNIVQEGLKIVDILKNETNNNLELLRIETNDNFKKMDEKYDAISKGMFAVVERLEKRDEMFEAKMENTEKNIESLLKILTEKKS